MAEITPAIVEREKSKPIRDLGCNCCGNAMRGRQWWNRDTGYGMCDECIVYVRTHRPFGRDPMSEAESLECYGIDGVHFNIPELSRSGQEASNV